MERINGPLPPHSEEAEQALLGSMLIDASIIPQIAGLIEPAQFYHIKHGWIYESILACGEGADLLTVGAHLAGRKLLDEAGGEGYLALLTTTVPTAVNAPHYARIVEGYAVRRAYLQAATEIARLAAAETVPVEDVVNGAMRTIDRARKPHTRNASQPARDAFEALWQTIEARHNDPTLAAGIPTGYGDIDKLLGGGFHKGELIIVAARPGMGKTSLLNCMAANIAGANPCYRPQQAHRVAYYSLEMSAEEWANRLASTDTGIDSQRLRAAQIKDEEWAGLAQTVRRYSDSPLYINEYPQSVASMAEDAERLQFAGGLGLVIADYLGLFEGNGDSYERTSRIARELKNTAKRLGVPVVCAAQLSRSCESRDNKRPQLSDLRDSGEIEQAADVVMFIYRDEYYNSQTEDKNIAEINIAKQRNGPTGTAKLFFEKRLTAFRNLSRERIQL